MIYSNIFFRSLKVNCNERDFSGGSGDEPLRVFLWLTAYSLGHLETNLKEVLGTYSTTLLGGILLQYLCPFTGTDN